MPKAKNVLDVLRKTVVAELRHNHSLEQIGADAQISVVALKRFLRGRTMPRINDAERLARAIGCEFKLIRQANEEPEEK